MSQKKEAPKEKEKPISFGELDFEEALTDLLQVKPMPNEKSKAENQKKKKKTKEKV